MDPLLVHAIADWFDDREEMYRDGGAISARRPLTGDAQHDHLARFGRDATWGTNHKTLIRFNAAFGARDLDAALMLVTDDIVFETTSPAPDGQRHEGRDAVRTAWTEVMRTPGMSFTEEESFVSGDRAVVRWRFAWAGSAPGHVRDVDVLRLRAGLVCEKLSYVKGSPRASVCLPLRRGARRSDRGYFTVVVLTESSSRVAVVQVRASQDGNPLGDWASSGEFTQRGACLGHGDPDELTGNDHQRKPTATTSAIRSPASRERQRPPF